MDRKSFVLSTHILGSDLDRELLGDAVLKLASNYGLVRPVRVEKGQGFQSRTSVVVPLLFTDINGTSVSGFYKSLLLPPRSDLELTHPASRARFTLGLQMSHQYGEMIRSSGIRIDEVLAADVDRGVVVTLKVPGEPMGRALKWALTSRRRRHVIEAMRRLGRAVSKLEGLAGGRGTPDDDLEWRPLELALERLNGRLPSREIAAIETTMGQLYDTARSLRVGTTFSHGDLSSSNLLIGDQLGIVDFGWVPRLCGYDLAVYTFRLDYEAPAQQRWVGALKDALFETYDRVETIGSPPWRFVRLRRILWMVGKNRSDLGNRWRINKGLEEIRRSL